MTNFLLCMLEILLYTLGILTACGLAVEICYRISFFLMGKRAGKAFWIVTSTIGAPVHELGHALMCVLFAHKVEKIRFFPDSDGVAMVDHSYKKGNLYAAFGNIWIGFGPIFSGLAVVLLTLGLVFPESFSLYFHSVESLVDNRAAVSEIAGFAVDFLRGMLSETSRPLWARILAVYVFLSMALHIRLSAADIRGMMPGVPMTLVLTALVALIFALMGMEWIGKMTSFLQKVALLIAFAFSLILIFSVVQLVLVLIYRLLYELIVLIRGDRSELSKDTGVLLNDYRDRDWEEFRK